MEKRDWLAEKIQMLKTQSEGFEADLEKVVSEGARTVYCLAAFPEAEQPMGSLAVRHHMTSSDSPTPCHTC